MAKKRGGSPLGNAPGSAQAQQSAAKANLETLTAQLNTELEKKRQKYCRVPATEIRFKISRSKDGMATCIWYYCDF